MGNSNATPSSSSSVSLADFVNTAPATGNSTSSTGFDASKMSGKPCTRILFDEKKFDSDSCQNHFKDNSKSLPKPILKKITKAFKDHNQDKDAIDKFLLAVDTKV